VADPRNSLRRLTIFVHRASECLTDHESHGEGLICFSLLNGLAERGHTIYAYSNRAPIDRCSANLHVRSGRQRVPANSLAPWEHAWKADRWFEQLDRTAAIDLVWRMTPGGEGCPTIPRTHGKPLVIGPLYTPWPASAAPPSALRAPRFGFSIQKFIAPVARRGWRNAVESASLVIACTASHASDLRLEAPQSEVIVLPLIVEPPADLAGRRRARALGPLTVAFVANLEKHKNPLVFIKTIGLLLERGIDLVGNIFGDGSEMTSLRDYCSSAGLERSVKFFGKTPNVDVYRNMASTHFLISTSIGEPYGRSIAEAMSVGTPCVCHRSGGPAAFLRDGVDGVLVDEVDASHYANAIMASMGDETWNRLSHEAVQASQAWRKDVVLDKLEATLLALAETGVV